MWHQARSARTTRPDFGSAWLCLAIVYVGVWLALSLPSAAAGAEVGATAHPAIRVQLAANFAQATQGRLLVFAQPAQAAAPTGLDGQAKPVRSVDVDLFAARKTRVFAREVSRMRPGEAVDVHGEELSFPEPLSMLPPGDYDVQAVLDVNHSYSYHGRHAGNIVSEVMRVTWPSASLPLLTLTRELPARDPWQLPKGASVTARERLDQARAHTHPIDFVSAGLSRFWGRPIAMRGWVLMPPSHDATKAVRYPTAYFTHGFGGDANSLVNNLRVIYDGMADGNMPPMIWVLLDGSGPSGTHEFVDSVNNGPWATALTAELIPYLEARFPAMDATPGGRLLHGVSSGGWAMLWLQLQYPESFGGVWAVAPDPTDFHAFTSIDLYANGVNFYRGNDGTQHPLARASGEVVLTMEDYAKLERVTGSLGGQLSSMEWVFSPRSADGRPMPLFDRDTGKIDAAVLEHWRVRYDIDGFLRTHWSRLASRVRGKIHVFVGGSDTFYLERSVQRLQATLRDLGGAGDFEFIPERNHFDVYQEGLDRWALLRRVAWQMQDAARASASEGAMGR